MFSSILVPGDTRAYTPMAYLERIFCIIIITTFSVFACEPFDWPSNLCKLRGRRHKFRSETSVPVDFDVQEN